MKVVIVVAVWVALLGLGYLIDSWLWGLIMDAVPNSDWSNLIGIILGVVLFLLTGGFIIGFASLVSSILLKIIS